MFINHIVPPEEQAKDSIIDHEKDKSAVEEPKKKKTKEELEREKERKKQKRLDIRAIEFDWIFSKDEGVTFLENLATTDNIELFSLTLIRYIIRFLWTFYRKAIVLYLFIPFLIYFTLFILYATWIHDKAFDDGNEYSKNYGIANIIMIITILIFISYFFYFEIRQMMFHKLNYFISFWNLIDLISLILNGFIMIYDLSGGREQRLVTLQGIAVLFIWLKLFYFGRIFLSTAAMIRMIIEITVDMKYFLVVLLMAI